MTPDFTKGLLPAIIQDTNSLQVRMLGYMNKEALQLTKETGIVHFFSRSKNRIWKKGETSGNVLRVENLAIDCDNDTFLITVTPEGPTCHLGNDSCFNDQAPGHFLGTLEKVITDRAASNDPDSYTNKLLAKGPKKIAQKIGEEGVEVALEAERGTDEDLLNEMADLFYHSLVLLKARGLRMEDLEEVLRGRH